MAPASLPRPPDSIERRFVGSISVRIVVEVRLHERLQEALDHHLGNAIGDRRYPKRPCLAVPLRYVYPSHRRRMIAARRHSVPTLVGFPYFPLRNVIRLCSIQGVPPIAG